MHVVSFEMQAEIEKVKKRREERALEKAQHEEEMALLARERARAQFQDWEKKEDAFHFDQSKVRSVIRMHEGRMKPIDVMLKHLNVSDDLDVDLNDPYIVFTGLTVNEMEELRDDIKMHLDMDRKTQTHIDYWEESREKSGSIASKTVKRSKGLTKRSKTKFEEFVEMDTKNADVLAQEDLEMERKLAKKLKLKDGKLRGMDDEINFLFEGIPALNDCFDRDPNTEEFLVEGFEKETSVKQRKKRKEVDKFSGNGIAADISGGVFKAEEPFDLEKEWEESNTGTNSQRKLKRRRKKKQEGSIPGGTSNNADNMVGVSEPGETSGAMEQEFANGTLARKRCRKRMKS